MTTAFKPSEVDLVEIFPPLVGAFGKGEREAAATQIIRACVRNGDVWQPVLPEQLGKALKLDVEEGIAPLCRLVKNPFWRPDFFDLISEGYAKLQPRRPDGDEGPIELTDLAFEKLSRYVILDAGSFRRMLELEDETRKRGK